MKKIFLISLIGFLLSPFFIQAEELIIWTRWGEMERIVKGFNEKMEREGRTLRAKNLTIGGGDFTLKFTAALKAGERIDVANIDLIYVPYYAAIGALQDITDFLVNEPYYDKLNKPMMNLGRYEGKYYSIPAGLANSGIVYNKKLLNQFGFNDRPKNWADMITMCKAFAGSGKYFMAWPGDGGGGSIYTIQPMLWANGGSWISKDGLTAEFNHPKNIETYKHYRAMMDLGCVPKNVAGWKWGDKQDGFLAGDIAMIGTGSFMINTVKEHLDKVDPGYMGFIGKDGSKISAFVGGDLTAIPVTAENKEGAMEYLKYTLSREAQVDIMSKAGQTPARSDFFKNNPYMDENALVFAEAGDAGEVPYSFVYDELIRKPYTEAVQKVWTADVDDIEKIMDEYNEKAQKIIDEGY